MLTDEAVDQQFPSRWAMGQHDDTAHFWGKTFRTPPGAPYFGTIRMNVYEGVPDEFGNDPPIFAPNVNPIPHTTFRGFLKAGLWYEVRRGLEGPKNYIDNTITNWQVIGDGVLNSIPIYVDAGGGAVAGSFDGTTFNAGGPWLLGTGQAPLVGERFAGVWVGNIDSASSFHNFVMQCADGSK